MSKGATITAASEMKAAHFKPVSSDQVILRGITNFKAQAEAIVLRLKIAGTALFVCDSNHGGTRRIDFFD